MGCVDEVNVLQDGQRTNLADYSGKQTVGCFCVVHDGYECNINKSMLRYCEIIKKDA